jgi:hypothetical protein
MVRHHRRGLRSLRGRAGGRARDDRHVSGAFGLSAEDAYVLASLCVDLRISEIVDAGQYVVSAVLPMSVFTST